MTAAIKKINIFAFGRTAFWAMIGGVILMILAYIYFVNAIVWNVAARQQSQRELSSMTADLASLESEYVTLTSSVNIDNAYTLGFKDTSSDQTHFVKRSATLGSLSMRQVQ